MATSYPVYRYPTDPLRVPSQAFSCRCGKVVYATRRQAMSALELAKQSPDTKASRAYWAWRCQVWHLTSESLTPT